METEQALVHILDINKEKPVLERDLSRAIADLREIEAKLATEQAAVNRFRMQHRLKIGDLVEEIVHLQATHQSLLTAYRLQEQDEEADAKRKDPFAHHREEEFADDAKFAETIAPFIDNVKAIARDVAAEKRLFRELARRFHPDRASSNIERSLMTTMMTAVNVAYGQRDIQTLRDLADEIDPQILAQLETIASADLRALHQKILRIKRRHRRALQRMAQHRQEHTVKIWVKATKLEAEGEAWWTAVRADLQQAVYKFQEEIANLRTKVHETTTPIN